MNTSNAKQTKTRKKQHSKADAKVDIGSRVSLAEDGAGECLHLEVVASLQPGARLDQVSSWSPLGKALLGRRVGESIYVEAPIGTVRYQILAIMAGK